MTSHNRVEFTHTDPTYFPSLGPPGAGKSTLKRRLLDMPLPEVSFSTPVADAPLQVAMIRDSKEGVAVRSITQEGAVVPDHQEHCVKWTQQNVDEEAVFLAEHLTKANDGDIATPDDNMETTSVFPIVPPSPIVESHNYSSINQPPSPVQPLPVQSSPDEYSPLSELLQPLSHEDVPLAPIPKPLDQFSIPESQSCFDVDEQSPTDQSLPQSFTEDSFPSWCDTKNMTADVLSRIIKEIKKQDLKNFKDKFQKLVGPNTFVPLQVIDTGGQPEFHEMLPAFITGPAINLLVFKLTENLQDRYEIEYRLCSGNSKPYKTSPSHEEMIFRSLSSIACLTHSSIGWNIGEDLEKDKSESAAFLIGTHRDLVEQERVATINEHLRAKLKSSRELFGTNLVQSHSEDQVVFAIDNINDKDEIEHLQRSLNRVIEERFHEVTVPTSWYAFSMKLRKRKASILSKKFCIKIAKECGIPEETFMSALWYLHHRVGLLMHFPEVEGLRDVVIIQLQVVFDRITSLITSQFTFEEISHAAVVSDFSNSGMFTEETLRKLSTKERDPLTPTRIVSLLQCLHIVAQLKIKGKKRKSEMSYFMPCALKPFVLGTASSAHVVSDLCPPPLLVWFECGYTPVGAFCCLVVYLLEITDGPKWSLVDQRHYRNKIKFNVGPHLDEVSLIAYPTYIEVRVERGHLIPEPLGQLCSTILTTLDSAIETVTKCLHYSCHSQHFFGFYCPSCPSYPPHPAVKLNTDSCVLKCVLSPHTSVMPDNSLWYNKVSMCVYVHVCACVCMYVWSCMYAHVCMYVHVYVSLEICFLTASVTCFRCGCNARYVLVVCIYVCLFIYIFFLLYTDTNDISDVMEYLHSCNRWLPLGLKLGLFYHTLQRIELENVNNIEKCRIAMLDAWLQKQDGVGLKGGPTYRQLIGVLRSIREGPIADKMEEELVRTSRKRPSSAPPAARDPKYPRRK